MKTLSTIWSSTNVSHEDAHKLADMYNKWLRFTKSHTLEVQLVMLTDRWFLIAGTMQQKAWFEEFSAWCNPANHKEKETISAE